MASARWRDLSGGTAKDERGLRSWVAGSLDRAASNRPGIALAALGVVSAMAAGLPALLLAVPLVFTAVFAVALFDGAARRAARAGADAPMMRLPDPSSFYDARAKSLATRLVLARRGTARALLAGPEGAAFDVTRPLARVPRVERDAVVLLARFDSLTQFIDAHPVGELHGQIDRLRARGAIDDPRARAAFGRAAARCQERLDSILALQVEALRLLGAVEEIVGALEQVPVDLIRLQARRIEACDDRARAARSDAAEALDALAALGAVLSEGEGATPSRALD
jgi:hypothetical protein